MRLAERVAANDERRRLLVVHRHAAERFANELGCKQRVRIAAGALRVHIDQAHVIGTERSLELPLAAWRSSPSQVSSAPRRSRPAPRCPVDRSRSRTS